MLLALDVGNTNVVFALVEGNAIKARWRIATDPRRTADEYAVWLNQLLQLEGHDRGDVEAVIISTVVPRALHNLEVLSQKYFGVTPLEAARSPFVNLAYAPSAGRRYAGVELAGAYHLDNRWVVKADVGYKKLTDKAADSPIVKLAGDDDQFSGSVGVSYSFDLRL